MYTVLCRRPTTRTSGTDVQQLATRSCRPTKISVRRFPQRAQRLWYSSLVYCWVSAQVVEGAVKRVCDAEVVLVRLAKRAVGACRALSVAVRAFLVLTNKAATTPRFGPRDDTSPFAA